MNCGYNAILCNLTKKLHEPILWRSTVHFYQTEVDGDNPKRENLLRQNYFITQTSKCQNRPKHSRGAVLAAINSGAARRIVQCFRATS